MRVQGSWVAGLAGAMLLSGLLMAQEGSSSGVITAPPPIDDVVKLAKAGVSDEVMIAWVETLPPYARIDAEVILKLRDNKVSEKVIAVLIRHGGTSAPSAETREVTRYEVPPAPRAATTTEYVRPAEEPVRYTYAAPAQTVYVDSAYSYPASYYPSNAYRPYYYGSSYYPYYSRSYYGSSYGYYPRYGYSGYGYRPSFGFSFNFGRRCR